MDKLWSRSMILDVALCLIFTWARTVDKQAIYCFNFTHLIHLICVLKHLHSKSIKNGIWKLVETAKKTLGKQNAWNTPNSDIKLQQNIVCLCIEEWLAWQCVGWHTYRLLLESCIGFVYRLSLFICVSFVQIITMCVLSE